jgi:hypothetical protein
VSSAAAGVAVIIVFIVIVRAVWKRNNPGARLAAILGVAFGCWLLLAVANPGGAVTLAAWTGRGVATDASSLGHLIGML